MNRKKVIKAINSCKNKDENEYDSELYRKINFIPSIFKKKNKFNIDCYEEIFYFTLYIYHLKRGINTLSKRGLIPDLIGTVTDYDEFKSKLNKYKEIEFHHKDFPDLDVNNLYDEVMRLTGAVLLNLDFAWTRIYASMITGKEDNIDGKLYISVDNKYLYQFAIKFILLCVKNGVNYEFKVNNDESVNRTDNVVIYFTKENLGKYLEIIKETIEQLPRMQMNYGQILGYEIEPGIVLAKDYEDGNSFTSESCEIIKKLNKKNIPASKIVDTLEKEFSWHLGDLIEMVESIHQKSQSSYH